MTIHSNQKKHETGFTLVELSIVLVIIGLIIGGVLTGQDLIKAAQVRAQISQINNYNASSNTFREKYNGLPGDLLNASSYFAVTNNSNTTIGEGNGDGIIQSVGNAGKDLEGETALFFFELNAAGLIPDPTNGESNYTDNTAAIGPTTFPNGKLAGIDLSVYNANGTNYWILSALSGASLTAPVWAKGLTSLQASQIDGKIDDGYPATGNVMSIAAGSSTTAIAPATAGGGAAGGTAACYNSTPSPATYAVTVNSGAAECLLSVRVSF